MVKLKFIFSSNEKVDIFSTNSTTIDTNFLEKEFENSKNTILSYTLNELPLTNKLVKYWPNYLEQQRSKNQNAVTYHYNYYLPLSPELLLRAKQELNNTINELNNLGHDISLSLCMDISSSSVSNLEIISLNKLHFLFENSLGNINKDDVNCYNLIFLWEKVNNLIHFIETKSKSTEHTQFNFVSRVFSIVKKNFYKLHDEDYNQFNFVSRVFSIVKKNFYKLHDEDYNNFTQPQPGDLVADYSTVGKDLFACFLSNDMELVRKKEVKQQEFLTDYFFLHFRNNQRTAEDDHRTKDRYYQWCYENKVDEHYSFLEPKYNCSRHVFGKIDQSIYTTEDFYNKVFIKTPTFLGCAMFDNNGKIIR
jgi:hypothetical protein